MKKFMPLILIAALSGCAPSTAQSPAQRAKAAAEKNAAAAQAQRATEQAKPLPDISESTSYRFSGKDNLQKTCSTGVHDFGSHRLLCIHLQDPSENSECALDKRLAKFNAECTPELSWEESISCHFALLDLDAVVAPNGTYDAPHLRQSGDVCAGRTPGGVDFTGNSVSGGALLDGILYDMETKFLPGPPSHASFKMSIYRKDGTGKHLSLADDFQFQGGFQVINGVLRGESYRYVIRCSNDWACAK